MPRIAAVILCYNEEPNIRHCLESVRDWCDVFVVDSGSSDRTVDICREYTQDIFVHAYSSHAAQWQWALDNLPLQSEWVLVLDSDFVVTDELKRQILNELPQVPSGVNGIYVRHRYVFGGGLIRFGGTKQFWLRIVRRWTLVPWIFLTLGIVAGAWWSYEVLGWGGYWAWDPVENAALLPWLTATAFVHSAMVAERRGGLRIWTGALVIATFVLTLVGTFLTRSGIVASVHSFTQSAIGPWFLGGIVVALGGALTLLVWRLPELTGGGRPSATVSRESAFLLNNVLFLAITFAVLLGTLLPLLVTVTSGATISVGAPWFNTVTVPMLVALLFLMGVGPALPWGAASLRTVWERFSLPLVVAVAVAAAALALGLRGPGSVGILGLAVFTGGIMLDEVVRGARARRRARGEDPATATWRLATRNRRRYGGYLVHVGVLVMAVGVAVSSGLALERTVTLAPGESVDIGAYTVTHERLVVERLADDPRVVETRAELRYEGPQSGRLGTALRDYPSSPVAIATPAVRTSLGEDLYVTLLASDPDSQAVSLHLFVNPLVVWIWIGGAVVGLGAGFAIWPERQPRRATVSAPIPAAAGSVEGA